nr:PAS domain S-box protein [Cytophagales bacterium]
MDSERILSAIGKSQILVSSSKNFKNSIQGVLSLLGEATGVDRVYVFKNHLDETGNACFSYKFEWVAEGVEPQLGLPLLENVPWDAFSEIADKLAANVVMNERVEDHENDHFKETMRVQGILSYLFIPVFAGKHLWGFIGFDNCTSDELFKEEQKTALHALATTLGAVILNKIQRKRILREKAKYKSIVNNVKEILFELDVSFRFTFLNPAWSELTGFSIEEGLGRSIDSFIKPEQRKDFNSRTARLSSFEHEAETFETKFLTKNGTYKWVKISLFEKVVGKNGSRIFSGFVLDIDKEKQASFITKEISDRYQTVLKNVNDIIYVKELDGSYNFISDNIIIFGFKKEDFYSNREFFDGIIYSDDRAWVLEELSDHNVSPMIDINYRIVNNKQEVFWVNDRRWLEFSNLNDELKIYGRISDITSLKAKELEIEKNREELSKLNELLQTVNETQVNFLFDEDFKESIDSLLVKILSLTGSQFGFMGEALYDENGKPYLKSHTITNISWSKESEDFYQKNFKLGIEFRNLESLFGYSMVNGVPVISNDPQTDYRSGGTPQGHPPLTSYLGIPVFKNEELLGLIGLANKEGGFSETDLEFLKPITNSYANFLKSLRISRQRKQAEEEKIEANRLFKLISESANDIIALHDMDSTFKFVSASCYRVLGYKPEELLGNKPDEVFNTSERRTYIRNSSEVVIAAHEHKLTKKKIYIEINITYIKDSDGTPTAYLAVARDVTERELMLDRLVVSFEREKELNVLKSRFISMTSHELRTPLSTVLSSNEILQNYLRKMDDPILRDKALNHTKKIERQVNRLNAVINDILILEKNAQGSLTLKVEPIPIKALMQELCSAFCEENRSLTKFKKSLPDEDKVIMTDSNLLRHILSNLIENAIKYGKPYGEGMELALVYEKDYVEVNVKDEGIGIPEEDQRFIFDSFYRGKNADLIHGTGLGLYIVHEFTLRLGGSITFKSVYNEGSTFTLRLPYGT